jgi:hypothetical protein
LREAIAAHSPPPSYAESRFLLAEDEPAVWGLDSVANTIAADAGKVLVVGSHGALLGGRPESALGVDAAAAVFNDAGLGADRIGISRLPVLASRGIPAAAVDCMSARIGDARSMWESGVLSHVNAAAATLGARAGMSVQAFAAAVSQARRPR